MTHFLVSKFISDYQNTKDKAVRNSYAFLAAIVGIVCNIILFVCKFLVGYLSSSISVMTDSFNNLSDVSSSVVIIIGFKLANKSPDKNHPFGYGRFEYISTLFISVVIMYLGFSFLKDSIYDIFHVPMLSVSKISILILFLSLLTKIWLSLFNKKLGMAISSKTLLASSVDCKNDVIITFTTIFSMLFTYFTGIVIEGFVGTFVSGLLLWSGFVIFKETISSLLGESVDKNLNSDIKKMILNFDGVLGVHDLIVHNYGPSKIIASIHVEVADDMPISYCHDIIERIEKEINNKLNIELVIHADPIAVNDPRVKKFSAIVNKYIKSKHDELNAYDFRIVEANNYINLIFDLVIPFGYNESDANKLKNEIGDLLKSYDNKIMCIINSKTRYDEI